MTVDAALETQEVMSVENCDTRMRGWWPVITSADLDSSDEAVRPLRVHGDDLVVWRGDSGQPHVLDAFCRHLGAHLGYNGRVCGEDIRCFYHGWTWGPDGQNTDIPYDSRTHRGRRVQPFVAAESGGLVFLWYPGDSGEPDRAAPDLSADSPEGFRTIEFVLSDPQRLLELYVDPATAGMLIEGRLVATEVLNDSQEEFAVRHRSESGEILDATVRDTGLVSVSGPGWKLVIGMSPVVDDSILIHRIVSVTGFSGGAAEVERNRLEAVLDQHQAIASTMGTGASAITGAGAEALTAFRVRQVGLLDSQAEAVAAEVAAVDAVET